MSTPYEIGWAAGFFDGEGHCSSWYRRSRAIRLQITQIDRYVLDRFAQIVGCGSVYCEGRTSAGNLKYVFRVGAYKDVKQISDLLMPHLSPVKQRQIALAFTDWHKRDSITKKIVPVALHGTVSRYSSKKHQCRCELCRRAYASYHREFLARRKQKAGQA